MLWVHDQDYLPAKALACGLACTDQGLLQSIEYVVKVVIIFMWYMAFDV